MRIRLKCNVVRGGEIIPAGREIEVSPAEAEAMKDVVDIEGDQIEMVVMDAPMTETETEIAETEDSQDDETLPLVESPSPSKKSAAKKPAARKKSTSKKTTKK